MFMLIFAKAAFSAGLAFGLAENGAYAEMLPYGIPAMVLFAACAPLAAHLADRWRRNAMMAVFFIGIGLASVATSFAQSPLQVGIGLAAIGVFAAIYHPVGISMVIQGGGNVGWRLGVNGVWGNMGVAGAPLLTGLILSFVDWRAAFYVPGAMSVALGLAYVGMIRSGRAEPAPGTARERAHVSFAAGWQRALVALALVTAAGGFVFGAMTFLVPRLFDVRMTGITEDIAITGALAAIVYAAAAFSQLAVGRLIDRHRIKPVLLTVALAQPVFLAVMALETDYALFAAALLAMAFVFGQIPITDAVLARYVPDQWRTKVLSVKFLLNLGVGALAIMSARWVLANDGSFETVMLIVAGAAAV
ncbi:MAG: MFS transporter, partial [Rhodospirillaceae bacterium]|nr:MFS transporter [Rhodospirillaceae bacterium]